MIATNWLTKSKLNWINCLMNAFGDSNDRDKCEMKNWIDELRGLKPVKNEEVQWWIDGKNGSVLEDYLNLAKIN
jgi:hypothetical protein